MALDVRESLAGNVQALKEYYTTGETIYNLVLGEGAFFGMVPKFNKFSGKTLPIPMIYGNPQGGSAVLSIAQANKSNSQEANFAIKRFKDYALASVDREARLASEIERDRGSWMELAKTAIDGALNVSARSVAIASWRDGSGIRGQISTGTNVAANVITLADINDVANFEAYMYLQLAAARPPPYGVGTGVRGTWPTNQLQILSVDRNLGTLTMSANINTVTGATAGDFLCRAGDFLAVSPGVMAWLVPPAYRPTAAGQDNFYTQDRWVDKTRLMGVYHDGTQQPLVEAVIDGERKAARENAHIDSIFMNNVQYGQFIKDLSGRVIYDFVEAKAQSPSGPLGAVGFSGIQYMGAGGPVRVFPDFNCPASKVFGLTLKTWKLYSLKDIPHIFDLDSDQEWLREASNDSYECRTGGYYVLGCRAPGLNVQIDVIPAV